MKTKGKKKNYLERFSVNPRTRDCVELLLCKRWVAGMHCNKEWWVMHCNDGVVGKLYVKGKEIHAALQRYTDSGHSREKQRLRWQMLTPSSLEMTWMQWDLTGLIFIHVSLGAVHWSALTASVLSTRKNHSQSDLRSTFDSRDPKLPPNSRPNFRMLS